MIIIKLIHELLIQQDVIDNLQADGHIVTFIDDWASEDANNYDVVFLHEDVNSGTAWSNTENLLSTSVWVVTSETHLFDNLFGLPNGSNHTETSIDIVNTSHPITSAFSLWTLELASRRKVATGLTTWTVLANGWSTPSIIVWNTWDALQWWIGNASGRRAIVPIWNEGGGSMNSNAKTLLERSILWAWGALD